MAYPYRCSRDTCRQRTTLARRVEHYLRDKPCPACGHHTLRLDRWKQRDHRTSRCHCPGWWFPHRRGSHGCHHYTGRRNADWEHLNAQLGAMPIAPDPGARCPF